VEKTYVVKGKTEPAWVVVDANDQNLGRLATEIASYLMGKHKPTYTPGVDMGDYVVVINASRLSFTPKRLTTKMYHWVSGYPSGISSMNLRDMMVRFPERVIRRAVWGMLPHNKVGRQLIKRLKIYTGNEHPHIAQNPKPVG